MNQDSVDDLKAALRTLGGRYPNRLDRARRVFVEERACALRKLREIEYSIKLKTASFFEIKYSEVCFTGSAQLGFSPIKDSPFQPGVSDLDLACVSTELFQKAWMETIDASRAFTDSTAFSHLSKDDLSLFKDQLLRRGMIKVAFMPKSKLVSQWREFEDRLSREFLRHFGSITVAIYMNEYAFCWKQDSALANVMEK